MTDDKQPQVTPLYKEDRYTKFYLTMLILSTIGTAFSLFGVFTLPQAFGELHSYPVASMISLFGIFVELPAAILAIIFLWQKKILGLWIKLGSYVASILSAVASLVFVDELIKQGVAASLQDMSTAGINRDFISSFISITLYGSIVFAIILSIAFGLLWYFAWKNQATADADKD